MWRHPLVQAFFNDRITLVSATFLLIIILAAVFAPLVAPYDPEDQQVHLRHQGPMSSGIAIDDTKEPPLEQERYFLLGTDHLGRDYLSRLIYGGRISISVGLLGVLVSSFIGVFLGVVAGFYRGMIDDVIMRAVDVFMAVPLLLLALMVLFILGPSFTNIIIVFAIGRWMLFCRVTRGMVLSLKEQAFVDAALATGCSDQRIMGRHILPNLITPVLTLAARGVPQNILTESTLSFLGFGIQPPESSWGLMLAQGRQYIVSAWWVVVVPGMAIFLSALSFNLFGVWMRAVSDPLQRWRWLKPTKESMEAGVSV
jgi:peptide/nickel transport system permease protein